jgi:hypothetical protein
VGLIEFEIELLSSETFIFLIMDEKSMKHPQKKIEDFKNEDSRRA